MVLVVTLVLLLRVYVRPLLMRCGKLFSSFVVVAQNYRQYHCCCMLKIHYVDNDDDGEPVIGKKKINS